MLMVEIPLDASTVLAAQRGDGPARDRLLEEAYRRIFRYQLRLVRGNREEAQELTQESVFRLIRALGSLREPGRLIPWFFRIASNVWRDHLRRRRTPALTVEVANPPLEPPIEKRDFVEQVLSRLGELPEIYRQVLTLRYLEGLDYQSLSAVLECPVGTTKSQVARGLELIRQRMEGVLS